MTISPLLGRYPGVLCFIEAAAVLAFEEVQVLFGRKKSWPDGAVVDHYLMLCDVVAQVGGTKSQVVAGLAL